MSLSLIDAATVEEWASRAAGSLRARGVTAGDRVVLLAPASPHYLGVVLGALRSGVIPVPLDPRLTASEREPLLQDVQATMVVDDPAVVADLVSGPRLELDPYPRCRPLHFTSGTTGRPKGVWSGVWSPELAAAAVLEERELWDFVPEDVNLVLSPIYHSAPLRFALGTILAGGSVAMIDRVEPGLFSEAVDRYRPTTMFCVPTHLHRLLGWLDAGHRIDLSSFRLVAHAGAPCPEQVRRRVHALLGTEVVWEFYGSTEGQFTACRATEWLARPGTVGRARAGRTMTVDEDGQLWCTVPPWGEFSYWGDPEKTAAAWRETPAGPAFTLGDLGRIIDGYVYLDARRTDLVITGGVNVYPAEVEAVLESVAGVTEVAVFGRPDPEWGQRVCAAVVGTASEDDLRAVAIERLAPPKRPKEYLVVEELPRTATGKVRRGDLGHQPTSSRQLNWRR